MYTQEQIENFTKTVVESLSRPSNNADGDVKSKIDKTVLKELIEKNVSYRDQVIRLIAELCKDESQRKECVQMDLISSLKEPLESGDIRNKIESCRALGNMCYENADGCALVMEKLGAKTLFNVCRVACQSEDKEGEQLRMMTLGALHNMINSNEKVAEDLLNERILEIFLLYIPYLFESKLILFLFSICSNLIEHDTNCQQLVSTHLLAEIGNQISEQSIYENRTVILPYLLEACEEDQVKDEICSSLFYYKLIHLCEEYADKDEEFLRETCYILVVLITTDRSIERLLTSKEFDLLSHGISWLEKTNLQLKMTGALIITNLTRNDQSAVSILSDSRTPHLKLIEQLKYLMKLIENRSDRMTDEQAKVSHGILGALRNLSVPTMNRSRLAGDDVIENVLPYLFVKSFNGEIAYKATGVIRFLLRDASEETKSALLEYRILQIIVENSQSVHAGLQFESRRLIFLLPVALKNLRIVEALADHNAFPLITSTLASCEVQANPGIIQNEALIALNVILMLANRSICEKLNEANFHENVKTFLKQEVEHPEMINNFLQLIHLIKKQSHFLTSEQLHEYKPLLENLRVSQKCGGRQLIDRTLALIQNELE